MKSSYFSSLFSQNSADSVQELAENRPITTTTTIEPQANFSNIKNKTQYKQSLTAITTNTTITTPKNDKIDFASSRGEGDTTQDCFRDIFASRLQKASIGLPVALSELVYWFAGDKLQIEDYSITDNALRIAVASYVKFGLGRELRSTSKIDIDTGGMIRCLDCYYWLDDWCSNQDISTGARNTIDPQRLRRCKGFYAKTKGRG